VLKILLTLSLGIFSVAGAQKMIEVESFLKAIAHNESGRDQNIYDWEITDSKSSVIWDIAGVDWSEKGFKRQGKFFIGNNGNATHRNSNTKTGKIFDGFWNIHFTGDKHRLINVLAFSNMATQDDILFSVEKVNIKKKMICENSEKIKSYLYYIHYPEKKPFWMKEKISISEKGQSNGYMISYDERPSCKISDMSEDKKNKIIERCSESAGEHISFDNIASNIAIGACELALELKPNNKNTSHMLGRAYRKNKEYSNALLFYNKASAEGNVKSDYSLGIMYSQGTGVATDIDKAKIYFMKAEKENYSKAMIALGVLYTSGMNKDLKEAEKYFRKAVSTGDKSAKGYLSKIQKLITNEVKDNNESMIVKENK
jgi:tetratricopeptide (TPR) repeat protein